MSNISWVPYFKPLQFVISSYSSINGKKRLDEKYKNGWRGDKILVHFKNLELNMTTNSRGFILNQKIHWKLKSHNTLQGDYHHSHKDQSILLSGQQLNFQQFLTSSRLINICEWVNKVFKISFLYIHIDL